jgi:hypothetical protein
MRIKELVIFAHPTRGAALEVANSAVGVELAVAEIRIVRGGVDPAQVPVAWITISEKALEGMGILLDG